MEENIIKIIYEDPIKWAELLRKNTSLFKYHKEFIDDYMKKSRLKNELFKKRFGTEKTFKINARKYLKKIGLIS